MHPLIVRSLILPMHERLLRRPTLNYLQELESSQWRPLGRLRELQQIKLRRLLKLCVERFPFHCKRLSEYGIDAERVTLTDLARLPTLSKSQIRDHLSELVYQNWAGGLYRSTTGGSTGQPLEFFTDRSRQAADQAARARSRRWFGIDLGERELYLWGSPIEASANDRVKAIRDRLHNHLMLDAFRMTPVRMSRYLDEIQRFDPVHVFGYPSSIARLARHALACGTPARNRSLRAVFVTGELLTRGDRAIIEEIFGIPVADGYGSREAGFIAHQCPEGAYHVTMESLIVELVDAAGVPVQPGNMGEVVVTHLDARGMPFIRYRTGDMAKMSGKPCACGRGLETLEIIEGRKTDMLSTADGGNAHALSVIYVLRDEPTVEEFKVIQRPNCDLVVMIVARGELSGECRERIERRLRKQIGQNISVAIQLVTEIPPDPSGKHRCVVSSTV